jgi:serine/threonine protein kinase
MTFTAPGRSPLTYTQMVSESGDAVTFTGSQGVVYKVTSVGGTGKLYAIKCAPSPTKIYDDPTEEYTKAVNEVAVLHLLRTKGVHDVPTVKACMEVRNDWMAADHPSSLYVVMDWVQRMDFSANRPLLLAVCIRSIQTLGQIHRAGVVHCDIKPANVLFDGRKLVFLDFGVSKHFDRHTRSFGELTRQDWVALRAMWHKLLRNMSMGDLFDEALELAARPKTTGSPRKATGRPGKTTKLSYSNTSTARQTTTKR